MTDTLDRDNERDRRIPPCANADDSSIKACRVIAQLNRAFLQAVIQAFDSNDIQLISALGLPLDLAKRLTIAPANVIEHLGKFRSPVANFVGDAVVIERLLNHNLARTESLKKVDELLQLGGCFEFISRLTGFFLNDVSMRATALGVGQPGGRARLLTNEEWRLAESAWIECAELPILDRWIQVAKCTGISIRRLHAAYRKYDYIPNEDNSES